ncbi:hypothetical protein CDA63_13795 [Hymenobacter amundsenii]|uniref:DUF2157 domain-containing protein n=1 Tax=Hymenobacter amundsenii TaxID=2006685 RepID=A0A246FIU7_9BACT|nr:hypothetical protein [Hymenobacter amundsenii]OWP62466.1 hypothetical protein CDA63_13795 [Hymenobacter amundsenii]
MIKAYNPTWAHQEALRQAARRWQRRGQISQPQLQTINETYPLDFYRPVIYLRILLFLLVALGYFAATGILGLFIYSAGQDQSFGSNHEEIVFGITCLLASLGGHSLLLNIIRSSRTYRAGSDQALLYISLGLAAAAIFCFVETGRPSIGGDWLTLNSPYLPLLLLPVLGLLILASVSYADPLVAATAYLTGLALVANILLRFGSGRLLLPFAVMAAAAGLYYLVRRLGQRADYWYYRSCLLTLQALALATFYLGGNYLVVREANAALSGELISQQLPFALVFYLLTAVIPLVYLAYGLHRPNRVWLLTGLAALAFSGYTVRFYHSVLPPTLASALLGAFLVALMALALRYLRTPRHGLTAASDDEATERPGLNLEALIVAQTAHAPQAPEPGFQFGGGQSGGGGAEGQW